MHVSGGSGVILSLLFHFAFSGNEIFTAILWRLPINIREWCQANLFNGLVFGEVAFNLWFYAGMLDKDLHCSSSPYNLHILFVSSRMKTFLFFLSLSVFFFFFIIFISFLFLHFSFVRAEEGSL